MRSQSTCCLVGTAPQGAGGSAALVRLGRKAKPGRAANVVRIVFLVLMLCVFLRGEN